MLFYQLLVCRTGKFHNRFRKITKSLDKGRVVDYHSCELSKTPLKVVLPKRPRSRLAFLHLLYERCMALVILLNVGLVIFDLTYVKNRNFYLKVDRYWQEWQTTPQDRYLATVDALREELSQAELESPQTEQLLQSLRQQSRDIFIDNPPFRVLDRYGILAEIAQNFQEHIGTDNINNALNQFWSADYLARAGWENQLDFFDREIRYLISYYEPQLYYDIIKGIEPYRSTQDYLRNIEDLKFELSQSGASDRKVEYLLDALQDKSRNLMQENDYFMRTQQRGTLEHIKYQMKRHIYGEENKTLPRFNTAIRLLDSLRILDYIAPEVLWAEKSSTKAFLRFWSLPYLEKNGWRGEFDFFQRDIEPLMQSFYYRHIGFNNEDIERFWLIDLPFLFLFWIEFIVRTFWISRTQSEITWGGAVKQRWFDIFLLLPEMKLLRIIPLFVRLDIAKLPDMGPIRDRLRLSFIGSFAKELTEVIVNRGISQLQNTVGDGKLKGAIIKPRETRTPQVEYTTNANENDNNHIKEIVNRLVNIAACNVLPEIQPDLESLLHYQVEKAMQQSSIYRGIRRIPLVRRLPKQVANRLVMQLTNLVTESPRKALTNDRPKDPDPVADALKDRLVQHFGEKLRSELQRGNTIDEIEIQLVDFLENLKIGDSEKSPKPTALKPSEKLALKRIVPAKTVEPLTTDN